jgi:hypothetical protein
MRVLFLLLTFASFVFANIPTQTNTPYAQVITESKEDAFQRMLAKVSGTSQQAVYEVIKRSRK